MRIQTDHLVRYDRANGGIKIKILGDSEPFSRTGRSTGYQVTIGKSSYLLDCGATIFQQFDRQGIDAIKGIVITHCHDDHKRWLTDLLLFKMYRSPGGSKVRILTSEGVRNELLTAFGPALNRSLSADSRQVVDIPLEEYFDFSLLGPEARYRIVAREDEEGRTKLAVVNSHGAMVGPDRAKIVIHPKTKRPRLLFRDPQYGEWIEPESFYPFSSDLYYEGEKNVYNDEEGFSIEAINAPVWHGIPSIGVIIRTSDEMLVFSSDTVHDRLLWKNLAEEKRQQWLPVERKAFEEASLLYGDINDYIERTWSRERYAEAEKAFQGGVVIHDVASRNSVVHTDYEKLKRTTLDKRRVILAHSPDAITSEWVLTDSGKVFLVKGDNFHEVVDGALYDLDAAIYHREGGHYFVGYRSETGRYAVFEQDGLLGISRDGTPKEGRELYRVNLYEDVGGRYFPKIERSNLIYRPRSDGKVEIVTFTDNGSVGRVVESVREALAPRTCQ